MTTALEINQTQRFIDVIQARPLEIVRLDPKWVAEHAVDIGSVDLASDDHAVLVFTNDNRINALLPLSQFTLSPKRNKLTRIGEGNRQTVHYSRVSKYRYDNAFGASTDPLLVFITKADAVFVRSLMMSFKVKLDARRRLLAKLDQLVPYLSDVDFIDQLIESTDELLQSIQCEKE